MTDYVLLTEEEIVLIPEKTEEGAEESIGEVLVEIPEKDQGSRDKDKDLPVVWPWIASGAVLLALTAAVVALWMRKRKKTTENGESQSHVLVEDVKPTMEPTVKPTVKFIDGAVHVGKLHHIGRRESQQDSFAVSPLEAMDEQGVLAVVADGMGGLKDGDKVSQLIVSTMLNGFVTVGGHPQAILLALAGQASQQVNHMLGSNVGRSGSTLVAGLVRDGQFHYISIGDSRICLFRDGQLLQLNREHIYRNDLAVRALNGIDTLQSALSNPRGGGLTSYIGMGQLKYVDIPAQPVMIQPKDKFILMSDGVYNALTEDEMISALRAAPEQAAEQISSMIDAKAFRNQDNYTAVILGF